MDHILSTSQNLLSSLKTCLLKAQHNMNIHADNKRRDISYNVGDWVYVELRPFRQTFASLFGYNKISKRYYGPFQISKKLGKVSYHLTLPPSSKIHNIFHYSLLKPHQGPLVHDIEPLIPLIISHSLNL